MDTLQELEHLSLVSKIASEINNHVGVSDTTLAEFVIDQHLKSKSGVDEFKATLQEMGAEFPESLVQSIDRLMRALHPKYKQTSAQPERTEKKHHVLKGLSIPDTEPVQVVPDSPPQKEMDVLDDTFAMLEGLAGQHKSSKRAPPDSPPRTKKRSHDYVFEDEFGRTERKSRRRRRSRSEDEDFRRPPTPEIDDEPILYKVYRGKVVNIKPFGVFVNLQGVRGKVDGLVHVSQMQEGARVNDPNDLVSRWQEVFVKVIKIEGQKLSLSMKSVDQESGHDLQPQQRIASGANMQGLGNDSAPIVEDLRGRQNGKQNRKRLTSPERWEIKQLIASGVVPKSDFPDIDEDYREAINGGGRFEEEEDEVEIEVREEEPPFLVGQTKQSLELSPIRVVKAPDGSMNRAAMTSASLAQERRELRQEEAKEKAAKEAAQVDLSSQWNDPMAQQKQFASDLRNNRNNQSTSAQAMPEWKKISTGRDVSFGKRTQLSMKEQRESLPVFRFRKQLLEAIAANSVLVIVGDTGSGKTTQFTQYLAEAGYANEGMIGCTQPRRVAAMSVAKRVAEEVGCKLGYEVGYTIRFEDCTNKAPPGSGSETRIKYMTDGILLREILLDPMLSRYSVIMLDEAHERSLNTDVLMGLMKKTLKRRPDLKFIVTSATLDADLFSSYYDGCPIFSIPGRTFPVEILYSREPESDYLDASLATVLQIHLSEDAGDILLFLTGKEEIDTSCEILSERMASLGPSVPELIILPIYGALPSEIASLVFDPAPPGARKVIIATNIAETSLTIDGIKFVIDPGFVKQSSYDPKLGMDRLQVVPISQAQARQRSGRAGRTGPGKCFRLYTEAAYQSELSPTNVPEIQRTNLVSAILQLKALGVNDLLGFDFISPPPPSTILAAMEELYALGCLDDEGLLTRLGRQSADFPMVPHLASALIKSSHLGCSEEVLTMVSCISGQNSNLFTRPKAKEKEADAKRAKFFDASGDFQTFVNVYQAWLRSGCDQRWCIENYIQPKTMMRIRDVRQQLVQIMQRHKQRIVSCGNDTVAPRKAICAGFFRNSARKDPSSNEYRRLVDDTPVHLHPSSALFGKGIQTLLFFNVVETSKEYMSVVAAIEPKWLVEAAPTFFKVAPTDRLSKRKKAERIQPLQSKWAGEDDWRLSAQRRQGRGGGGTWG